MHGSHTGQCVVYTDPFHTTETKPNPNSNTNCNLNHTDSTKPYHLTVYVSTPGWSKKRRDDGTDDGTPGGQYAIGHCPIVVYVRRTHDGILARGVVQATGQTMRHV